LAHDAFGGKGAKANSIHVASDGSNTEETYKQKK